MRLSRWILLSLAILGASPVAAERLVLDPAASSIRFTLDATGHTVRGTLALAEGWLSLPSGGGEASGRIVIDARSAETGNKGRDETMHGEVLESEQYPALVFTPRALRGALAARGESAVVIEGELAIHGVTKAVSIPATIAIADGQLTATAEVTIPFVAWGMHDPSVLFLRVAKEVMVSLEVRGHVVAEDP